jgi:hypothetical protein
MWTFLSMHGITALRAIPLILLSSILIVLMFHPLELVVSPKLPPLLPLRKEDPKKITPKKESELEPIPVDLREKEKTVNPFEIVFKIIIKIEKE